MRIITNRRDIENAYNILINRLNESCDHQISVKLGHKGETIPCKIYWSKPLGLWYHSRTLAGSRYWNAFGLSDDLPIQNSLLPIVCEINPPLEGLNRQVQGAFLETENEQVLLIHRGKIGGGKQGIGRPLFFNNYQGKIRDINGKMFAIIGNINSTDFVRKVEYFVKEVDRIKSLV